LESDVLTNLQNKKLELLVHGGINFLSRSFNVIASVLITLIIPWRAGVDSLGLFMIGFSVVLGIGTFSRFGLSTGLVKWGGHFIGLGQKEKCVEIIVQGTLWSFLNSVIISAIALSLFYIFPDNNTEMTWNIIWPFLLTAPIHTACFGLSSYYKVINKTYIAPFIETAGASLLTIIISELYFLYFSEISIIVYSFSYLIANLMILAITLFSFTRNNYTELFKSDILHFTIPKKEITWRSGLVDFAVVDIINYIFQYGIIILLGLIISAEEVGIFSIILRISLVLNFILLVFNTITTPQYAKMFSTNKIRDLRKTAQMSSFYMLISLVIVLPFLIIFANKILLYFSENAASYQEEFFILLCAQVINVLTGSSGPILSMTGNQNKLKNIVVYTSIIATLSLYWLTSIYGLLGGCIAISMGIIIKNIWAFIAVKRCLGFYPLPKI